MTDYGKFVSLSSIKAKQEERNEARKLILGKAKRKYEAEERREKKKKERGEDTWMLDTVSKRIQKEQKNLEDTKSKGKKKKKKKKHRKHSDSSASSSENSEEEMWVESKTTTASNNSQSSTGKIQRESWMEAPLDFLPAISRQEIRDAANKEKELAKREAEKHLAPGQHARELNPYWKDGGSGLPTAQPSSTSSSSSVSGLQGDGGLSWLLKALSRMKEQAKDEGRSLEDIAAERYGSLDRLMSMIREAEKSRGRGKNASSRDLSGRDRESGGKRDYKERYSDRDKGRGRDSFGERNTERDREGGRYKESRRSNEREEQIHRDERSRHRQEGRNSYSRSSGFRRPGSDNENSDGDERDRHKHKSKSNSDLSSRFQRPGSDDEGDVDKRDRYKQERSVNSGRGSGFHKPLDDELRKDQHYKSSSYEDDRRMFRKPSDDKDDGRRDYYSKTSQKSRSRDELPDRRREYDESGRKSGWRRSPEKDNGEMPRWKKRDAENVKEGKETKKKHEKASSSDSGTSTSEDENEENRREKMSESDEEPPTQVAPKVMSEAELNELAAKVLRAEIMGDEDHASQLKATLEKARQLRESSKTGDEKGEADFVHSKRMERGGKKEMKEQVDDNVVVLSRTNKAGMIRPVLPSSTQEWGGRSGGKKRKKKNVTTHSDSGERTKFFHDDDNFDLKTLVEREKAGTAEDQNSMFARLAGRENDRDLDVDDMFVSKAARGQQEEQAVNRDKMAAIMEHRKRSSAMEKCSKCFDKVPKHLIIAIGRKSYLCLPDHASLTEGHCLIVPMAHSSSATSLDEDVWQDMQQFRKSLVQMFLAQEKDVVVMETVMHLKHFPHTIIECIPLEQEVGDLAPIYFKKAMLEVGPEWSHNKKVQDLSKKDIRHTIPKGFPYFSVDFGLQGGFAHVIEDEATFSSYFGREIVGGMLDAEPGLWRKPRKQNFEDQRQKVLQFEQWWSPFDWTQDIG